MFSLKKFFECLPILFTPLSVDYSIAYSRETRSSDEVGFRSRDESLLHNSCFDLRVSFLSLIVCFLFRDICELVPIVLSLLFSCSWVTILELAWAGCYLSSIYRLNLRFANSWRSFSAEVAVQKWMPSISRESPSSIAFDTLRTKGSFSPWSSMSPPLFEMSGKYAWSRDPVLIVGPTTEECDPKALFCFYERAGWFCKLPGRYTTDFCLE